MIDNIPITRGVTLTLLASSVANTPGPWTSIAEINRTFVVTIEGTKSLDIEGSADGVTALPAPIKANVTASGAFSTGEVCHYVRVNPQSGDGTASVIVMI